MSREAFEACVNAFWDGDVGHLTPNDCLHAVRQAAQADAYERAERSVKSELLVNDGAGEAYDMGHNDGIFIAVGAIRALAKEAGNA